MYLSVQQLGSCTALRIIAFALPIFTWPRLELHHVTLTELASGSAILRVCVCRLHEDAFEQLQAPEITKGLQE